VNQNRFLALILASALLTYWYMIRVSEEPATFVVPTQPPKSPIRHEAKPHVSDSAVKSSPTPPTPSLPAPLPPKVITEKTPGRVDGSIQAPPGAVPFDLVGDYVIAFGDILLGRPTVEDFPKNGFIEAPKMQLWENGQVPYSIHASLPNHERVLKTIQFFNTRTPVRFVPYKDGDPDSIVFMPGEELCLSYLGRIGGNQPIYLSDRCTEHEITHELMHALGFIHEQSRPDRDRFLRILWRNIEQQRLDQFVTVPESLFEPMKNRPFDFRSVMLYPADAFAKAEGLTTMESLGQAIDPVANGLSDEDFTRLELLYNH
jgi:hypothetical protein